MNPHIYLVTAVYNNLAHTRKLVKSFLGQTYKQKTLIILDDASSDSTVDYLTGINKDVVVIPSSGNNWWTGGINLAITHALKMAKETDYILTINNDCTITPDYLKQIIVTAKKRPSTVIGSVERDQKTGKASTGVINIDWLSGIWTNSTKVKEITPVNYHTTKGTLFPVSIIKNIGLLDQKHFPHYASDIEYTNRVVKYGYQLLIDPHAQVFCDQDRTGLRPANTNKLIDIFNLAFSRKSTVNIIDHFNLIKFCCPPEYKIKNYVRLVGKALYLLKKSIWP